MKSLHKQNINDLHDRLREIYNIKHMISPGRRITKLEREIGAIKKEIDRRNQYDTRSESNK